MKSLLFTFLAVIFLSLPSTACDKCHKSQATYYAQPYAMAPYSVSSYSVTPYSTPYMVAPYAVSSTPMTYVVSPSVNATSQLTFVPSSTFVAPTSQAFIAPSTVLVSSMSNSTNSQSLSQQGLIDAILGNGRPAACEVCRLLGCENAGSGGGSSKDPLTELRETIKGIGELIRSIKSLEKDVKDSLSMENESSSSDLQIAELSRLRDELRAMNSADNQTHVASKNNGEN